MKNKLLTLVEGEPRNDLPKFDIGDTVELQTSAEPVAGTVEALTLRITMVRAFDGTLNIVPNGNILVTSNKTRGWGRAIIDLRLPYDQDVDQVREILTEILRVVAETIPSKRWEIERSLREQMTNRLIQRGVAAPPIPVIAPHPAV